MSDAEVNFNIQGVINEHTSGTIEEAKKTLIFLLEGIEDGRYTDIAGSMVLSNTDEKHVTVAGFDLVSHRETTPGRVHYNEIHFHNETETHQAAELFRNGTGVALYENQDEYGKPVGYTVVNGYDNFMTSVANLVFDEQTEEVCDE